VPPGKSRRYRRVTIASRCDGRTRPDRNDHDDSADRAASGSAPREEQAPRIDGMKMFAITAAELEAMIKVEMEDICEWPTDMTVSVQPDRDTRKVVIMQDSSVLIPADTIWPC
jgi:hypothetical protein